MAQRSANAAKEIKSLITASVEEVNAGASLVASTDQTIDQLKDQVHQVTTLMQEIREARETQRGSVNKVCVAISLLDNMTQQNAALVEESSAAAQSLNQQAMAMMHTINAVARSTL